MPIAHHGLPEKENWKKRKGTTVDEPSVFRIHGDKDDLSISFMPIQLQSK